MRIHCRKILVFACFIVCSVFMVAALSGCATRGSTGSHEAKADSDGWKPLFDGKTLAGWKTSEFGGGSQPNIENGQITMPMGVSLSGITYTNPPPTMNYEVSLEAMKIDGNDFFCALTFLIDKSPCTFVVGGWGGGVVGLSSIDGQDASENETTKFVRFDKNKWYHIRLRVTPNRIQTWIDDEPYVDVDTKDRKITLRYGEIDLSQPFGLAAYQTTAAWRNLRIKNVK